MTSRSHGWDDFADQSEYYEVIPRSPAGSSLFAALAPLLHGHAGSAPSPAATPVDQSWAGADGAAAQPDSAEAVEASTQPPASSAGAETLEWVDPAKTEPAAGAPDWRATTEARPPAGTAGPDTDLAARADGAVPDAIPGQSVGAAATAPPDSDGAWGGAALPAPGQSAGPAPPGADDAPPADQAPAQEPPADFDSYWSVPVDVPPPVSFAPSAEAATAALAQAGPPPAADWLDSVLAARAAGERAASGAEIGLTNAAAVNRGRQAEAGPLVAPVPAEAAAYAAELTAGEEEDMDWEEPPEIGPDGRGPWLDGPDAPWGTAPSQAGRRALVGAAWGLGLGLVAAIVRLFLLN
jgi:hypothetical protein